MQLLTNSIGFLGRGGPAMIGLLLCSILMIAVIFERFIFLSRQRVDTEALLRGVGEKTAAGDLDGAIALCAAGRTVMHRILGAGLQRNARSKGDVTDALSIACRNYLREFEQNLAVIGTIAVIAPFIGLFGTVLGIIRAFDDIALKGNSSPAIVAAGVSEALVTTAAGLFVAVTAVVFFNYFRNQTRVYREDVLWAAEQLAEFLHMHETGALSPADVPRLLDGTTAAASR
jgi:biopolymer transport protein ExbB